MCLVEFNIYRHTYVCICRRIKTDSIFFAAHGCVFMWAYAYTKTCIIREDHRKCCQSLDLTVACFAHNCLLEEVVWEICAYSSCWLTLKGLRKDTTLPVLWVMAMNLSHKVDFSSNQIENMWPLQFDISLWHNTSTQQLGDCRPSVDQYTPRTELR